MASQGPDHRLDRVLVHAPFGRDGALLCSILQQAGLNALVCSSLENLCTTVREGAGAMLVGEEALHPEGIRALTCLMTEQPPWSDLPVLILTTSGDGYVRRPSRLRFFEALGNVTLLERPLRAETIISNCRMALRARTHQYEIRDHLEAQHRHTEALRQSEERYRTLAEALPQLVWTCLPDGNCDYLSRQWVEYTGIPEAEQLGLRWLNLVLHPEDREQTYRAWMTAVHDREPYDLEYRLRRRDGMYRWFRTRGTPLRQAEGKIQKWFGTCTDIDDTKRAAEERQELLAREREARRTAELLNQVGPLLAAELDTQQLAQKITDLATQLTGAQFGALFHNVQNEQGESYTLYTLSGVPREAFANFPMPRNTMVFGPTFRGEGVIRSADITQDARYGKNRPYRGMPEGHLPVRSYLAAPIVSRSGEVLGGLFFGSATVDVFTEQHAQLAEGIAAQAAIALDNARLFAETQNARNALEQSNAELRRANEDLNQFAYSASHDLKEPLRTVAIYSQMLQRQYGAVLDEQATQYLEYALQGVKRMELLLRDLVAYLQAMDEGEQEIVPVPGGEVFRKAVENLKDIIEESQATVDSGPLPVLLAREVHLLQLFQNLLGNALKYRGEAPPHIQVSAESQEGMWKISVRDNGIGIEPQYARQVFGLFKRLHGRNSGYEGTGIGLAICQKIVERYGGRIWVESEGAGQGSTFCFTLPGRPNA